MERGAARRACQPRHDDRGQRPEGAPRLKVIALGDCAAYVEFSRTLDLKVNSQVQRLAAAINEAKRRQDLHALRDVVPALGGLALHFDPDRFQGNILEAAAEIVERCLKQGLPQQDTLGTLVEVPVCYEGEFAPDAEEIMKKTGLARAEVANRHAAAEYRVLMMGFAPGHAYMGGLDPKLSAPRRPNPRSQVQPGSVAIANDQTVIYPYAISGGWNVIGRTPLAVFDPARARPSLFMTGDRVRFRAIAVEEFARLSEPQ